MSGYRRDETEAHRLDRNWGELVQELRVIGTGVQILFAFLLSIAFQARFSQTTGFERDVYLATLLLAGLAATLMIAPVPLHRLLFRIGVKDEVVTITNALAVAGLAVLSLALIGAILLIAEWVAGTTAAIACGTGSAIVLAASWFGLPLWLRARQTSAGGAGTLPADVAVENGNRQPAGHHHGQA